MANGLRRARWPLLGLILFACAGIGVLLAPYYRVAELETVETVAMAIVGGLATFWSERSLRLSLLVGLVPVVCGLVALAALVPLAAAYPVLCDVVLPHAIAVSLVPATGAACVAASSYNASFASGMQADAAAWQAVARTRTPLLLALLAVVAARGLLLVPADLVAAHPAVASADYSVMGSLVSGLASLVAVLLVLPFALGGMVLGEGAIADANRRREVRYRALMKLGFVGMPRWALSLSGIGLVFAVTFSLSSVGAATWRATGVLAPAAVVTVGIAAALALRNWRLALVVPLVALSAAMTGILLSFPGYGLPAELVSLASPKSAAFPAAAALATGPMLLVIARIEALRWFGDPLPIAIGAAMTEVAFPLVALASLLALALIPTGYALAPLVALGGALFLAPALLGALEILFPQTRTAEQLLRRPPV